MEAMAASGQPLPGSTAGASRPGSTSVSQSPAQQGMTTTVFVFDTFHVIRNPLSLLFVIML